MPDFTGPLRDLLDTQRNLTQSFSFRTPQFRIPQPSLPQQHIKDIATSLKIKCDPFTENFKSIWEMNSHKSIIDNLINPPWRNALEQLAFPHEELVKTLKPFSIVEDFVFSSADIVEGAIEEEAFPEAEEVQVTKAISRVRSNPSLLRQALPIITGASFLLADIMKSLDAGTLDKDMAMFEIVGILVVMFAWLGKIEKPPEE